ncbi:MAG: cytochrome c [Akkermansiaceae bacterium]|nr:cytochrome c [Verrucomicrobiales bacterium]
MKKFILTTIILTMLSAQGLRAEDAKTIYDRDCTKCHGADGKGETKMGKKLGAKDYSDPKVQAAITDEAGFKAIKEGFKSKEDKVLMKPSEGVSDADIKAVVAYLRTFKK